MVWCILFMAAHFTSCLFWGGLYCPTLETFILHLSIKLFLQGYYTTGKSTQLFCTEDSAAFKLCFFGVNAELSIPHQHQDVSNKSPGLLYIKISQLYGKNFRSKDKCAYKMTQQKDQRNFIGISGQAVFGEDQEIAFHYL